MSECTYRSVWNDDDASRPFEGLAALSALCGPGDFKPVRPEKSSREFAAATSKLQIGEMRRGFSCPTCGDGVVAIGDAICKRCEAEEDDDV